MPTKAVLEKDNAALKRRIARLEKELATHRQAETLEVQLSQTLKQRIDECAAELRSVNRKLQEEAAERTRTEQALSVANAKLEKLFEVLPVGISVLDHHGLVVKENPMLEKILELSAEGLLHGDYKQRGYILPDGTPFKADEFPSVRILAGETTIHDVDIGIVKNDNRTIWTQVSAAAVPFPDWKAVIVTRDISTQLQAEKALMEGERRFGTIFEHSPLAIGISRMDNNCFTDVNPAMCELFGYSREEMIGRTSQELGLWSNLQDRQRMIEQLRRQTYVRGFETTNRQKSGSLIDIMISAQIIQMDNEEFLLGQIVDITELKRAEKILKEREHFISSVLDLTPANIYVYDLETESNVFSMNGVTRLLGYSKEDIYSMGADLFARLTHPDDLAGLAEFQLRIMEMADNEVLEYELRAKHRDGSWRTLHTFESPFLRNADGRVKQKIGVAIDVTESKQAQQLLQEQTEELRESHERLMDLSRQLLEAQEQERRIIGRELHDEIGQNLTGLRILLSMAQRLPLKSSQEKLAQAQQVAGDLIDRISTLTLDLRPPMLDDLGLLPSLLWFMSRYTDQTNIQVDFRHSNLRDKRFSFLIETAVYRLVQEALTNVARHAGVVNVVVRIEAGNQFITTSVEDQGRGFDVRAAFDRRNSNGLSGMRERVHLLNGSIQINSAPGKGTLIFTRLPLGQKDRS